MIISSKTYYIEVTWRSMLNLLVPKLSAVFIRLTDFMRWLPLRLLRLAAHLRYAFSVPTIAHPNTLRQHPIDWMLELGALFLDCIGITELYETLVDFTKFNTRPLTTWEKQLAQQIFGDTINYERIRIDEYALAGP
ncbi:MAG: hypothetical protein AAGK47_08400, partial [Bacteroidota bacterium]